MNPSMKPILRKDILSPGPRVPLTRGLAVCLLAALVACTAAAQAATFYVDAARPDDSGNGLSWDTAKKTVQAGINAAASGDAVWVKAGTYVETITMKSNLSLYGGFAGTEAAVGDRNILANGSTLNASTLGTRYHVVTMNGLTNARLDGMSVGGGLANGSGQDKLGAGIYCSSLNSTNTIANCLIVGNVASDYGSGIACLAGSSPLISTCVLLGNGISQSPLLLSAGGAALYCSASSPTVESCTMGANYASTNGGGVYCTGGSSPAFTRCIFYANVATQQAGFGSAMGGAVYCSASTPSFSGCAFSGNSAANNLLGSGAGGGGVYLASNSPVTFTNCLFSGNYTGASGGGAVYCTGSAPSFVNCTISSNSSATGSANGGGVFLTGSSKPVFKNTLFENNTKYGIYEGDGGSDPTVSHCLFNNNPNGNYYDNDTGSSLSIVSLNALSGNGGDIAADPKFVMDGSDGVRGTWTAAPTVTNGMTTLTDAAASYPPDNGLLGRMLNANTTQRQQWSVISNTATTITIWGDVTGIAPAGSAYKIADYHLGVGSGAIDYGTSAGAPPADLEMSPRPVDYPGLGGDGLTYDIGAYEAQFSPLEVLSIVRAGGSPTNAASVDFTVTFNRPVTGVDSADFALTATGVSGASVTSVSADTGDTRTVAVGTGTGDGTIRLDLADNDTITDANAAPLGGAGAGNGSFTGGEAYTVDKTVPTGTVLINGNRSATNNPTVSLALTWNDSAGGSGVVRMRFSNDGATWSAWEPLAAARAYTLPAGPDGHRTVRVQYLDKANNRSAACIDYIRLDTTPPTGTIIINNGALTTSTQSVTLGLTWADGNGAQVSRMRFSDDGAHWTYWMPPEAAHAYMLPPGIGYHTVRVQYLDGAGNYSLVYNDYIKLVAP